VESGVHVRFTAIGSVTNPELLNVDSGAFIRINTTMASGDVIDVYTGFAGKRVTKTTGGTTTNAFPLLDTASTFLQLSTGTNTLRYDASDGLDNLEVTLLYRAQYLTAGG